MKGIKYDAKEKQKALQMWLVDKKDIYYVATLFDVSISKIESYCKTGRLKKLDKTSFSL